MGRNGGGEGGAAASVGGISECCMCGDYGLSSHLFICKHCRFRSQHKYCSNLYPEAESYHICNWCLSQKGDKKGELLGNTKASSPNSSSSSLKTPSDHQDHMKMNNGKRVLGENDGGLKDTSDQIKKQKKSSQTTERSGPSSAGRKRVTTDRGGSIGKKTRSEEVSNGGVNIIKQVFRNKVRRYKLLDEVPS
ncbi:uncharacterized protein LOC105158727 [Sesamum indicum]|uniref:Uncharacterized protein LOC105158727 n=1 Tax=Sesamum indicum TaxID=4182 RepID=A0A6I9STZ7_SESIN|nr:uncharacterized protein LOC105158727 [Sesamum indicum]